MAQISKGAPVPDLSRVNISLADEPLSLAINDRIECTAVIELPRKYLGASALHECSRQTQFAWRCKPLLPARVRSIFARGHFFEARTREHLVTAGFTFAPTEACELSLSMAICKVTVMESFCARQQCLEFIFLPHAFGNTRR